MTEKIHLSVVIPAYNEAKRLPGTLRAIGAYLGKQDYHSEIIVADGGSTDGTAELVEKMKKEMDNLELLEIKDSGGKGGAVKEGMMRAFGEYRVFTDADNSTSIDQVEKMWSSFEEGYDVVIGSRDIRGAVLDPPQPWMRQIVLGKGFKLYRKIVIGLWGLEDTQCGFKGFRGQVVNPVFSRARIKGFAFDPEILVIARKRGCKIKEIPISWKNDPDSKVKPGNIIKMAVDLLKIKWNLIIGKYD